MRGTGEAAGSGSTNGGRTYASGGLGDTAGALAASARADQNLPIYIEALDYPATVYQAPATTYVNSVNIGVSRLAAEIENLSAVCPNTNIVLVGYSQGAHVISNTLSGSNPPAFTTVKLSTGARAHVKAAVLIGSPSYRPAQPWNAPNQARTTSGLFPADAGRLSSWTAPAWNSNYTVRTQQPIIREWCAEGDAFCQSAWPNGLTIHQNYKTSSVMSDAWIFLYTKITSTE
ncbi:cutinase family protein [Leifsonia xyli]|uniref:cutinase family protein n=1 Tax=Leifsonia xyli TaxID=1575 RepID=UPI003D669D95